jgi:hypothetical protein
MKTARKAFLGLIALSLLTATPVTFARPEPSYDPSACYSVYDQKLGEWMYCCPSGCYWL